MNKLLPIMTGLILATAGFMASAAQQPSAQNQGQASAEQQQSHGGHGGGRHGHGRGGFGGVYVDDYDDDAWYDDRYPRRRRSGIDVSIF